MFDNPLVLQAISEVFNERFEAQMKELEGEEPHVFSEKHNKKMAKLIKNQKKPYYALISTAGRRAACIAVVVILFAATALSVKAIREAVFDFITHIFSDHTVVTTESGADDGFPETIEEEYYISALPEGFEETENHKTNAFIKEGSENGNKILLYFNPSSSKYILSSSLVAFTILKLSFISVSAMKKKLSCLFKTMSERSAFISSHSYPATRRTLSIWAALAKEKR